MIDTSQGWSGSKSATRWKTALMTASGPASWTLQGSLDRGPTEREESRTDRADVGGA